MTHRSCHRRTGNSNTSAPRIPTWRSPRATASDASNWISGQAIFLAGDSLALIRHPMEDRFAFMPEGWTLDDLETQFRHCMGPGFEQPGMQASPYAWFAGVGRAHDT